MARTYWLNCSIGLPDGTRAFPPRVRTSRRGMVLLYALFAMTVFVLFASLAVDMGHVRVAKVQLQFAADSAARAACEDLPNGVSAAQSSAVTWAGKNSVDGAPVTLDPANDVIFGIWDPIAKTFTPQTGFAQSHSNAVQIVASRTSAKGNPIALSFSRVWGNSSSDVHVSSTACLTGNAGAYSIIGLNSVTMGLTAYTDSYNAAQGAYNNGRANHKGSIASNGNISLSGSATVYGDARCGVGKSTTLLGTSSVTGLNAPLGVVMSYPSVSLPASYTDLGDVNMNSGTVSLSGGTYLIHNLVLSGTAHVIWTSPVVLYIQDSYAISGSAQIDTYQNLPANRVLNFLPTCATATWTGTNDCVGELYAPDTDFTVSGSVDLYGRILAKSISNTSSGGMHYDESLSPPGGSTIRSTVALVK